MSIGTGTTVYHLSVLQSKGYIRSAVSGNRKLFWMKSEFPGTESAALTELQQRIMSLLQLKGEKLSRTTLCEELDVPSTTLQRHLKGLVDSKAIVEEKNGKECYCKLRKEEMEYL